MVNIKDIQDQILLSTPINMGSKRRFTLQKEDYIILKFSVQNPIYFKLGCGVDDNRVVPYPYELIDIENCKPIYNQVTGGYDYELRLDSYYWKWKNKIFKYIPEHGAKEASWSLPAMLDIHLGIFLRNLTVLGYTYRGIAFKFAIDSTVKRSAKLVSYDNTNMIDALTVMAEKWECEWWITDNVIHFGRCEFGDPLDFEIDVNVKNMLRSNSQTDYATRIIAFGSTKNLPTNYRSVDEHVVIKGMVQKRLMLPVGTPYVDAYENMSQEEAVEDIVIFDDVYPRRIGTMSEISIKEYPNEVENEDGTKSTEKWNAYRFKDVGITFSKEYKFVDQDLKIKFESGSLNGMEFSVIFNPDGKDEKLSDGSWNPEAQLWEIVRNDTYGINLPSDTMVPKRSDTYILSGFDISLVSAQYLPVAEQELKEKAEAYLAKRKIDPSTYDCMMMSHYIYNDDSIRTFEIGDRVNLINKGYFKNGRVSRIIGFEYNLDKPYDTPVYTVGETAAYSRIGDIENKVDAVTYKGQTYTGSGGNGVYVIRTNDSTTASNSNVFSAIRQLAMFIRRDIADVVKERITFAKGLIFGDFKLGESGGAITGAGAGELKSLNVRESVSSDNVEANTASVKEMTVSNQTTTLNLLVQALTKTYDLDVSNIAILFRTIVKDYVSSETFVSGITGEGMKFYKALNGDWNLELDNITIRKAMTIFELIISKIRSINGGLVVSQGHGRIKSVNETTGTPAYYVLSIEGDMTFLADDFVRCQVFSTTGAKYYWVRVDSISGNSIVIPKSEFPDGVVPTVGDDLVQMGNKTNKARQGVLYLTASEDGKPRFSVLNGVDSTDLTGKNKVILGCLDGITDSDFPSDAQPSGYGLWAANVFLKGLFILRNGKSVEDELNDQITAVKTAFEIREGQISTKVQAATTAATQASGSASAAASSATTAGQKAADATKAASNAANILQTVTQKETNINQTAQAIELKATRAESAAGRAESAEASINVKADGIVMQAASSAAQAAIDGVQIGGVNLLPKSKDFSGASYYHNLVSETYNGFPVISYSNTSGSYVDILSWGALLTPDVNAYYTLSFFAKGSGNMLSYFYPNAVESGYSSEGVATTASDGSMQTTLTSEWKRYWVVWKTLPSQTTVKNVLVARLFNGSTVSICGVKFEKGNKATDWSAAPEDVTVDYTAKLQVLSNQISSKVSQTTYEGLNSRVSSAEQKITSEAINLTVSNQITSKVNAGIASTISKGKMLYRDPIFSSGLNSIHTYNNYGNDTVVLSRESGISGNPNSSGYCLKVTTTGSATPGLGGFTFLTQTRANAIFITRFVANIPVGYTVEWASNGIGTGGTCTWLTSQVGTGTWTEYVCRVNCGSSGSFSSTNFFYITGGTVPLTWYVSYATVFDTTDVDDTPSRDEIKAGISIVSGGVSVFGQTLSFSGKVTFSSLASDAQTKITTAQSTASSAASAASTANSGLTTLKNSLGAMAYQNAVSLAKLDTTIVEGGYIKTSLINADAIITNSLLANKIAATDITTGKLTVTTGARIGGWSVEGNALKITSAAGAKILVEPSGYRYLRINDTSSYLMEVRADSVTGIRIYTQSTSGTCLLMTAQTGGKAVESYGNHKFTARIGELTDFVGSTRIGGLNLGTRTITTSQTLLLSDSSIFTERDSGDIILTLPSNPYYGKMYFIRKNGGSRIWIKGSYIVSDGDWYRERSTQVQLNRGGLGILMFNGTYWTWNNMNG